jgi:hypothetical protein
MWMCAPASNPALAQGRMLAGTLADMRAELHTDMSTLPHENTHTEQHTDNSALRHIANAHMTARQQAHLRACPNCKLSHNTTSQQESMHT